MMSVSFNGMQLSQTPRVPKIELDLLKEHLAATIHRDIIRHGWSARQAMQQLTITARSLNNITTRRASLDVYITLLLKLGRHVHVELE